MWELTPVHHFIFFSCMLGIFALVGYLWVGIYKLWNTCFCHQPNLSSRELLRLLGWLVLVIATALSTSVILWFFWTILSIFYL